MSLIEKIDAEIAKLGNRIEQYENGNKIAYGISVGLEKAKEIILSEQEEPCEYCGMFDTLPLPLSSKELCIKGKFCPVCGRPLNQPSTN